MLLYAYFTPKVDFKRKFPDNWTVCVTLLSGPAVIDSDTVILATYYCLSNAIHCMGQNIKSLAACFCVSVCLCARTDFGGRISRKRLEIEVRLQWDTNRKRLMADRLVTWPTTSRDLERSRSWPQYVWCPLSRKRLEIETWWQWSTYTKWLPGNRMVTWRWR